MGQAGCHAPAMQPGALRQRWGEIQVCNVSCSTEVLRRAKAAKQRWQHLRGCSGKDFGTAAAPEEEAESGQPSRCSWAEEAGEQGGIARAARISAGTNPAALIRCCHLASACTVGQARRSLCYPTLYPPRLDASQWISMSHSNAEKLMIKKEFFFSVLFPTSASSPPCPHGPRQSSPGYAHG